MAAMLTRLKMYRADENTFTEIYGKIKAPDTQENADFVIKSKKTSLSKQWCWDDTKMLLTVVLW